MSTANKKKKEKRKSFGTGSGAGSAGANGGETLGDIVLPVSMNAPLEQKSSERYELIRACAEEVKRRAIQNPPDEPPLQTVPWNINVYPEQIPSKSELAKRTQESNYTSQKKK
jgi:hypothetical protein